MAVVNATRVIRGSAYEAAEKFVSDRVCCAKYGVATYGTLEEAEEAAPTHAALALAYLRW